MHDVAKCWASTAYILVPPNWHADPEGVIVEGQLGVLRSV